LGVLCTSEAKSDGAAASAKRQTVRFTENLR
jgi:hypothetical protein